MKNNAFAELPKFTEFYTKEELAEYEKIVEERIIEAKKNLESSIEQVKNTEIEATGDSYYSLHMADQGTEAMEREKAFLFAQRDEKYLLQLDDARARLQAGTFGICRQCGIKITPARLKAVPTTNICIECKTEKEKR